MRRPAAVLLGVCLCLTIGCVSEGSLRKVSWQDQFRQMNPVDNPQVVHLDVALIERRIGDSYINREVWNFPVVEVLDPEDKNMMEANGFRVGLVIGTLPSKLHGMLTSERCCVNPRRLLLPPDKETLVKLGPVQMKCRYLLDNREPIELEQAQCCFQIIPSFTEDGRTRLKFQPKVEFGEQITNFRPAKDRSGWMMDIKRQCKSHPNLKWEVSLAPNEYLIIGAILDEDQSLGFQSFVELGTEYPVQRLLVLRTSRSGGGVDTEIAPIPVRKSKRFRISPALAFQATMPVARAYRR